SRPRPGRVATPGRAARRSRGRRRTRRDPRAGRGRTLAASLEAEQPPEQDEGPRKKHAAGGDHVAAVAEPREAAQDEVAEPRGDEPRRHQHEGAQVEPEQARVLCPGPAAAPDHGLRREREEEEPGGGHERPHGRRPAWSPTSAARFAWASALDGSRRTARRNWPSAGSGCPTRSRARPK